MATVTGYVEKIKYRNDENGYSVLSVADGKEEYVLVGTFAYIAEGERIEATGRMVEHSIYGEQLSVESYEIKPPEDTLAIERYLGSGAIKGIGAALAKRIVKKFKADTFRNGSLRSRGSASGWPWRSAARWRKNGSCARPCCSSSSMGSI